MKVSRAYRIALVVLAVALPAVICVAAGAGAYPIDALRIPAILWGHLEDEGYRILLYIRLPRVFIAGLVGAALAVSGASLQSMFRNPLADPSLIGVTAGAGLAVSAWIVFAKASGALAVWGLPIAGFAGGLAIVWTVWRIARAGGATQMSTLLLTGIALNAIAFAGIGLFAFLSDEEELRGITFWQLGGMTSANWGLAFAVVPPIALGLILLVPLGGKLNALALGEREAYHLGVPVHALQRRIIWGAALAVGGSVAAAGGVGFIGLVVPHLFRLCCGADNRWLLPCAALGGTILLIGADTAARTVAQPAEIPVGVLTAIVGGPFFLWLLVRNRREAFYA